MHRVMLDEVPVFYDEATSTYVVSREADVRRILSNPGDFSSNTGRLLNREGPGRAEADALLKAHGWRQVDHLITNDPPSHRRYRALVETAFTPRRVKAMIPQIEEIIRTLIAEFPSERPVEFVSSFAVPLPMRVIACALGVPDDNLISLKRWSDSIMQQLQLDLTREQVIDAAHLIIEMQHYFAKRVEEARREPSDTLLSAVANTRLEGADDLLPIEEVLGLLTSVLVGGNETTTSSLGLSFLRLAQDQELQARLRADPQLIGAFVEESLRLDPPLQIGYRSALRDTEIGGVEIPAGAVVLLRWGTSNQDDRAFEAPDRVKLDRAKPTSHLSFGFGIHYCIGHNWPAPSSGWRSSTCWLLPEGYRWPTATLHSSGRRTLLPWP